MVAAEAAYAHGEPWLEDMLTYLRANHAHFARSINAADPRLKVLPTDSFIWRGWIAAVSDWMPKRLTNSC